MSRANLLVAASFAVFALSALASATASAAGGWDVNGSLLVGSAALASPAKVLEHGKLEIPNAGINVECTSTELGLTEAFIVHPDELRIKSVTFKSCQATAPCTIPGEAISTLPVHGLAELDGTLNTLIKLLPLPSKTYAVIHYEGATCALLGNQPITATGPVIHFLIHAGAHPRVEHLVLAFSLPGLKIGSNEATLKGLDFDLKLASGQTWNFL
jgi:hypothetical protein